MNRIVRKPDFCLCENKGADQLRSNCEADQRLCFRYTDSTVSLLLKSEISRFYPSSVDAQLGLCQTWSETPKTGFLVSRLTYRNRSTLPFQLFHTTVKILYKIGRPATFIREDHLLYSDPFLPINWPFII